MTTVNKPATKAMATAIAAVLCAHLAYAVTPTAVWSGNLGQSYTIDGKTYEFTINPGTGKFNQDGTLTVTNGWTGYPSPYINISANGATSVSVLVKFSGLSLPVASDYGVCIADMADSDLNEVGAYVAKGSSHLSAFHMTAEVRSPTQVGLNGSDNAVVESGYMLYSYSTTGGVKAYMGSSMDNLIGGKVESYKFGNGRTISRVSIGGDAQGKYYNPAGFKIEAVALFVNEFYTASDVALYEFPAKIYTSDVNVSTINTDFPNASEIDVYLTDGVTVTGDTPFTATTTKVNFHCDGSFNLAPPANNEAAFDFSGVTGRPVLIYGALPSVSGSKFTSNVIPSFVTDPTKWTGVIYISSATVTDFTSNLYGNESSVVRLGNVSGWLCAPGNYAFTNTVPVELAGTLTLNDGNSANDDNPNRCTVFKKLSGSGTISADAKANKVVVVIQDASEFTGNIGLNGKLIVFGDTMPSYADNNKFENMTASIWVMEGASVTARPASGNWWAIGGIKVAGELKAANLDKIGRGTTITTSDTGVLEITRSDTRSDNDGETDYSRVTGTGTIRFAGEGFTVISQSIPTSLTFAAEKANGSVVPDAGATIGSLTGSKGFRSDWNDTGAGGRYLTIKQSTNTVWDGSICVGGTHRLTDVVVDPGANSTGTLTMTATQTASSTLTVNGSVNLTGTWVGPTTVNGTLSGTGTVNGELTLADGSTLVANTDNPLKVSSLSLPATGTVTISLADSDIGKDFIISSSSIDPTGKKFAFTVNGEPTNLTVIKTAGGLKAVLPGMKLIFR